MKLYLSAYSIVKKEDGSPQQTDKIFGVCDPVLIQGFQLCPSCSSILTNGNYEKCVCGALLPRHQDLQGGKSFYCERHSLPSFHCGCKEVGK